MRSNAKRALLGLAGAALLLPAATAGAAAADEDLRVLVEDLRSEVSLLRRKLEVQEEAQAAKGPQPILGAGPDGFYLRSADRAFDLRLRGYAQLDARYYTEDDDAFTDTFLFRRVRPILEGTLGNVVDFRIMPDFANSTLVLQDAWMNLKYVPEANLMAGKFKAPFGLERLQSATALVFVERALPTQLVPNRDLGLMVHSSSLFEGALQYQLALMNGVTDGSSADVDNADGKDFVARVFAHPFQNSTLEWLSGLGLGVAVDYGRQETGTPSVYRTSGQATFFSYANGTTLTGSRVRYSPQFYYYWGPFGMYGEYVQTSTDLRRPAQDESYDNDAWQVAVHYVLTGENASYKGVIPREDLAPSKGGWGAWELAARYHELSVDEEIFDDGFAEPAVSAEDARAWTLGVNWYLNRWLKIALNYERTAFDGGGGLGGDDRETESLVFLRWQISY
jgi:phosphate-selective porin OprO/OprP